MPALSLKIWPWWNFYCIRYLCNREMDELAEFFEGFDSDQMACPFFDK